MLPLKLSLNSLGVKQTLISSPLPPLLWRIRPSPSASLLGKRRRNLPPLSPSCTQQIQRHTSRPGIPSTASDICISPLSVVIRSVGSGPLLFGCKFPLRPPNVNPQTKKSTNDKEFAPLLNDSVRSSIDLIIVKSLLDAPTKRPFADALLGFISGTRKATEVAHSVWQMIIRKGDIVVDATCGNGHDTLALLKMVANESGTGSVFAMDIQISALENASSLLDESVSPKEKKLVKLFRLCHSRMEDVIPKGSPVRLVAFNLGYLPGGDKTIITTSRTTLPALEAASRILESGGLLSTLVYVGHPGGREEFETVQDFASGLPVATWVCSKFEMLNRPNSPVLVLLFKK